MKVKSSIVRAKMAVNGYTLDDLAKASEISRGTLSAMINGKSCSNRTISKVAKTLEINIADMLDLKSIESEV